MTGLYQRGAERQAGDTSCCHVQQHSTIRPFTALQRLLLYSIHRLFIVEVLRSERRICRYFFLILYEAYCCPSHCKKTKQNRTLARTTTTTTATITNVNNFDYCNETGWSTEPAPTFPHLLSSSTLGGYIVTINHP